MRDFVENCVELFLVLILNIFAALYKLVTFFYGIDDDDE